MSSAVAPGPGVMQTHRFFRRNRRGRMMAVVRERYLRDDVPCMVPGAADDSEEAAAAGQATMLSAEPYEGRYLVLDANVALHQLDLLETQDCAALQDCIVPQTAAEEVRRRNLAAYSRLMALVTDPSRRFVLFPDQHHRDTHVRRLPGETPNDFNDRAIRGVAAYYQRVLVAVHGTEGGAGASAVTLLTDDADNRRRAGIDGIPALSCKAFAAKHSDAFPGLAEKVALGVEAARRDRERGDRTGYRPHLSAGAVAEGLRSGRLFRGTLRVSKDCWFEARVAVRVPAGSAVARAATLAAALPETGAAGGASAKGVAAAASGGDETEEMREDTAAALRAAEAGASSADSSAATKEGSTSSSSSASSSSSSSSSSSAAAAAAAASSRGAASTEEVLSVLVRGAEAINRATEGDVVVMRILPPRRWQHAWGKLTPAAETSVEEAKDEDEAADAAQRKTHGSVRDGELGVVPGTVPTAEVVAVIRRAWRPICGSIEDDSTSTSGEGEAGKAVARGGARRATFVPIDGRWPRVRLETRQAAALTGQRIVVALDAWPASSRQPFGHYVRTLGPVGDRAAETEALLEEHSIPTRAFSSAVMACLPPSNWVVTPATAAANGRRDIRDVCVCSIDPPGCKDIDDALHFRPLDDSGTLFEAGVHIADVTHFVRPDTPIDEEAASRANTTYLVERRLDMLPGLLTTSLCSLRGGVDRFAFSVTWRLRRSVGPDGLPCFETIGSEFFRSTIHSRAAMTYGEAQAILDDPSATGDVASSVRGLAEFSRFLRRGRVEAGALTLASPEVRFQLDSETHEPLDVRAYEHKETNSLVEEMMLLANVTVARRITDAFPRYAVLRRHPEPPQRNFDQLIAAARVVGVEIDVSSSKALQVSLDAAEEAAAARAAAAPAAAAAAAAVALDDVASSPHFAKTLRILATRCMLQAAYFPSGECSPEQYRHYGLASPIYTHFTSPIRRYADVMVHRLLAAAIGLEPLPKQCEDLKRTRELTDNLNRRHVASQHAGRASVALHTVVFFAGRAVLADAIVLRVRGNGAAVLVPRFGLEGPALVAGKSAPRGGDGWPGPWEEDKCEVDDGGMTLRAPVSAAPQGWAGAVGPQAVAAEASGQPLRLRVFDSVRVCLRVKEGARHRRSLEIVMVDPPFFPTPTGAQDWQDGLLAKPASNPADAVEAPARRTGKTPKRKSKRMRDE